MTPATPRDQSDRGSASWPLWPLPIAIAAILVVAVHVAWALSLRAGYVPACIPYLEGCTSISRAARHGLGNHVFRMLVLPCALLQGLHWWGMRAWLRTRPGPVAVARGAGLPLLGTTAALALALYATFLGSEGDIYRLLRRYGVVAYFGATYIAQLVQLRSVVALRLAPRALERAMGAVCLGMLLLGLASVAASALVDDAAGRDRWENILEWQLGVLLVAWFVLQGWLWRVHDLRLGLWTTGGGATPGDRRAG